MDTDIIAVRPPPPRRGGNVSITGRSKDLIKSGGEWINPAEIEAIVGALPEVALVAVVGRAHPKWGERPVLIVELRKGGHITDEALLGALRSRVESWWLPDAIVRVDAMPLATTGKIDKKRLRARSENSAHRSRSSRARRQNSTPLSNNSTRRELQPLALLPTWVPLRQLPV
jgi:acyl-CoA synthetase (AMP-forming)/AMP-acid ligase II